MGVGKGIEITAEILQEITSMALKLGTVIVKKGTEKVEVGTINANIMMKQNKIKELEKNIGKMIIDKEISTANDDIDELVKNAKYLCKEICENKEKLKKLNL